MAAVQNTTELPQTGHALPVVDGPAVTETAPSATVTATEPTVTEDKPVEPTTVEAPKEAEKKEEVIPIEEGHLNHKAQGASFPKNLIPSKEFFFFGSDAVESKSLANYKRSEKSIDTAESNIAWASHTGKGLLFIGDKKTPSGLINLSDATEPETDGPNKFTLTSKGNKHTFKAATTVERDNWVSQLRLKIAEAKELLTTVPETETYKSTLETFKPAPPHKKEEPVVEAVKEPEAKKSEEAKSEETPKEESKVEEAKTKAKRASFFGFGKKDEKKEEVKPEETKPEETVAPVETAPGVAPIAPVAEPIAEPVVEAPKTEETAPIVPATEPVGAAPLTTEETKPVDEATTVESPKEKPATTKRNSFFGSVFSKKEKKASDIKPAESPIEAPVEAETVPAAETAPVIPPVEVTTPLAVDVSSPATVPVETIDVPAASETIVKKDTKEKRKSSLPFAFGKRDKSPSPAVEGEEKQSAFSKLRATINRKASPKPEDKSIHAAKVDEPVIPKEETPVIAEPVKEEAPLATEPEVKPETVPTTTPAVTATA